MALTPRLEFRQTQSLVMTPQLMQAIKLLQMSHIDLGTFVENELEKNPLLQRAEETFDQSSTDLQFESDFPSNSMNDHSEDWVNRAVDGSLETNPQDIAKNFDTDAENIFPEDAGQAGIEASGITGRDTSPQTGQSIDQKLGNSSSHFDGDYNIEAFVSEKVSLQDHLTREFGLLTQDKTKLFIAQNLIDNIDKGGYIRLDISELAEDLQASYEQIEEVLFLLQSLEPSGICARNLNECLALQLKEKNRYDPAIAALLDNLDLLVKHDFTSLKNLCGVEDTDLFDMIEEVKSLDPKPGEAYETNLSEPVVPDVFITSLPDGNWAIELNFETLPKVLVDQNYYAHVIKTVDDETQKTFLTDCLQTANWLIKSLDQRAKTILKVTTEIVRQQDAFFTHGINHLRPLNLKTVADAIDMHESTVSRVTSNKYVMTPRGLFELKYFFTSAISSSEGGQAHSAEAVRHRIRSLIDNEDPKKILSDDALVKLLKETGIDIARRTVAKYREAMHISSSVQRRREKKALLKK